MSCSVFARFSFSPQSWKVCSRMRSASGNSASVATVAVSSANSKSPKMWVLLLVVAVLRRWQSAYGGDGSPALQLDDRG